MPIINYEPFKKYDSVKGVFLGGCIIRGDGSGFKFRAMAHAHRRGDYPGWICVRSKKRLFMSDGIRPSNVMLHELAHILSDCGHTDKFRRMLKKLGGRVIYNAKKRRRRRILYFGPVKITSGKFKDDVGYFDNYEEDNGAIVYFGRGYHLINPKYLKNISKKELEDKFKKQNGEILWKRMTQLTFSQKSPINWALL